MNSGALVVPSMSGQRSRQPPRVSAVRCDMSGATPAAIAAYEQAVFAFQNWRRGADDHVAAALEEAPDFVMAHALQAYMRICTRDPERVRSARPVLERLSTLPASDRERLHFLAIASVVGDDYERAKGHLGKILDLDPRDTLALHVAQRSIISRRCRMPERACRCGVTGVVERRCRLFRRARDACLRTRGGGSLPTRGTDGTCGPRSRRRERARAPRDGAHLRNDGSARSRCALVDRAP